MLRENVDWSRPGQKLRGTSPRFFFARIAHLPSYLGLRTGIRLVECCGRNAPRCKVVYNQ